MLRGRPEVKEALERMWPALSGAELVNDLFGFTRARALGRRGILTDEEQTLPAPPPRARRRARRAGPNPTSRSSTKPTRCSARSKRPGRRSAAGAAATTRSTPRRASSRTSGCTASPTPPRSPSASASRRRTGTTRSAEPRTFGHVLVDEAQDLTAMQWRMLARRCPSGSMTLVGDPGQASKPGAVASWDDVLAHLPTHNAARFVTLTINYRTPAEVMDVASRLLAVAAPTVEPSRRCAARASSRASSPPTPDDLVARRRASTREALARTGTVAVIAPDARCTTTLVAELADLGAVAGGGRGARRHRSPCSTRRGQGLGVRPRRRRRAGRARHAPIAPACGCSTSRSPARPRRSRSCTPKRCPKGSRPPTDQCSARSRSRVRSSSK